MTKSLGEKYFECIYCGEKKRGFTIEHVIPEAIGGNITINCVCKDCNSFCGREVDSEFVNSDNMKLYRWYFMDFLPQRYIPTLKRDIILLNPKTGEKIRGVLIFDKNGSRREVKFDQQKIDEKTTIYNIPATKKGMKAIEGLRKSKRFKEIKEERYPLTLLPVEAAKKLQTNQLFTREIVKIFLGFLAFKLGDKVALEPQYDILRSFLRKKIEKLPYEKYKGRIIDKLELFIPKDKTSHRLYVTKKNGYKVFVVKMFNSTSYYLTIEDDKRFSESLNIAIELKRKRFKQKINHVTFSSPGLKIKN